MVLKIKVNIAISEVFERVDEDKVKNRDKIHKCLPSFVVISHFIFKLFFFYPRMLFIFIVTGVHLFKNSKNKYEF